MSSKWLEQAFNRAVEESANRPVPSFFIVPEDLKGFDEEMLQSNGLILQDESEDVQFTMDKYVGDWENGIVPVQTEYGVAVDQELQPSYYSSVCDIDDWLSFSGCL